MIFGSDWSFIQNPKAASSAVTDALLPFCEPVPAVQLPDGKFSKHDIPRTGAYPIKRHRLGVVRNPYDRMVSAWSYLRERKPNTWGEVSFREFVLDAEWLIGREPRLVDFCRTPQMVWLVGCNKVFRFENLGADFAQWSEKHLGRRVDLGRTNQSHRSGGYAGYYISDAGGFDAEMIDTVRRRFWFDFETWRYAF